MIFSLDLGQDVDCHLPAKIYMKRTLVCGFPLSFDKFKLKKVKEYFMFINEFKNTQHTVHNLFSLCFILITILISTYLLVTLVSAKISSLIQPYFYTSLNSIEKWYDKLYQNGEQPHFQSRFDRLCPTLLSI